MSSVATREQSRSIISGFIALSAGEFLEKLIAFLAFALLARTLSPESYGTIEFASALFIFFSTFVEFGLGPVGVKELLRTDDSHRWLPGLIPTARTFLAAIAIPLMGISAVLFDQSEETVRLVWIFAAGLLPAAWTQLWLLQGRHMMGFVATAKIVKIVVFAVAVALFVRESEDILPVGYAELLALSCAAVFTLAIQSSRVTPVRPNFSFARFRRLAARSIPVSLSQIVWSVNQYLPVVLVANLAGRTETAYFGAANRLVVSVLLLSQLYHYNFYPSMTQRAAKSVDAIEGVLLPSIRVVAFVSMLLGVVFTFLAQPLVSLVFSDKLIEAAPVFAILVWGFPAAVMSGHARWGLLAIGRERCVLYAQLSGTVIMLVTCVFLIPQMQAVGAAIGVVLAAVAVWIVAHLFAKQVISNIPLLTVTIRPAALALAVATIGCAVTTSPWARAVFAAAAFALLSPMVDPRLIPSVRQLAKARTSE